MAEQPLAGKRIVVTRPESKPLANALERLGAEVSIVPLIEIRSPEDRRPLDAAVQNLAGYEWVVFTSVNGVAAVGERLRAMGAQTRVAAVGPVTADAVRTLGVEPSFVAARASEDIARGWARSKGCACSFRRPTSPILGSPTSFASEGRPSTRSSRTGLFRSSPRCGGSSR